MEYKDIIMGQSSALFVEKQNNLWFDNTFVQSLVSSVLSGRGSGPTNQRRSNAGTAWPGVRCLRPAFCQLLNSTFCYVNLQDGLNRGKITDEEFPK